jgi:ABC-type uncharacterized transport system ATPase subunit
MSKAGTMLYLNGVSVSFDGFKALNNLSIIVHPKGEMLAIIGPNGAGKTTMMDIITGKTGPTTARSSSMAHRPDQADEAEIANLGIGRKFQKPTVFESHTVWDNLVLALKKPRSVFAALFYRRRRQEDCSPHRGDPRNRPPPARRARTNSPPTSATARSSGWRSACCWRRTPSCCSSTNRSPA